MKPEMTIENLQRHIGNARELRELLSADPHRPRYHLLPPEGFFNDANCTIFWNGRSRADSLGVSILARGSEALLNSLDAWTITPTVT